MLIPTKKLQTDYLDLYLIHAPSDIVPIKETMSAMDKLVEEGLIRNITFKVISVLDCLNNQFEDRPSVL